MTENVINMWIDLDREDLRTIFMHLIVSKH